ncbi:MAG: stage II sporulation protein R [Eubacterium sp.]|nr:stage II sporulation protein R [Eubacterium sp.]
MKKLYIFIPLFIIFTLLFSSITPVIKTSENISDKIFRLHIIANSDSEADQILKLRVRDNILECADSIYKNCNCIQSAVKVSSENLEVFKEAARKTIAFYGYTYDIKAYVTKDFFGTRKYDGFTLPAGNYNCLKIVIGEGKGRNWWCVMFPQVCLSGCTDDFDSYFSEEEKELITSSGYKVRFKVAEIYEKLINRVN